MNMENTFETWYELNKEDLRDEYNCKLSSEMPPEIVPTLKEWAKKRYENLNS
jgi:hypothetical protein